MNDLDAPTADAARAGRLGRNLRQFVKFCFVGGSGVIVNLAVFTFTLLLWLALTGHLQSFGDVGSAIHDLMLKKETEDLPHVAAYVANAAGFAVSVVTNYYLNRRWTFRSAGRVARELPRFAAVSVVAYGGNVVVFAVCTALIGIGPIPSQLIAIACVMPINFALNKIWSFRTP